MERNSSGARSAPGAFGANGICSCDSLGLLALDHARLLGSSGAAANPAACESAAVLRQAMRGAASGRTGASGASQRGLRPHCDAAKSGFTGRRRRLGRALYPQRTRACDERVVVVAPPRCCRGPLK
jgi:hypothetical protein